MEGALISPLSPPIYGALARPAAPAREAHARMREAPTALLADWLPAFTALDRASQKQILDELALAYESKDRDPAEDRELDLWCSRVLLALQTEMGDGGDAAPGLYLVKRTMGSRANWHPVRDFVAQHCRAGLVAARGSAYALLANLLIAYCAGVSRRHDIPLGLRLLSQHVGSIAGIFNNAFPGYAQAGMIALVLSRQTKGVEHAD